MNEGPTLSPQGSRDAADARGKKGDSGLMRGAQSGAPAQSQNNAELMLPLLNPGAGAATSSYVEPMEELPTDGAADALEVETLEPGRALALSGGFGPRQTWTELAMRYAFAMGFSGSAIMAPFGKRQKPKLLALVNSPLLGERASGVALRAGHFSVYGVKVPIGQMDFSPQGALSPPFEHVAHGFTWLRDLAASAATPQCAPTAGRVMQAWCDANPVPTRSAAWKVENVGNRLRHWLLFAPLILADPSPRVQDARLAIIADTARWLDRNVHKSKDKAGEVTGWCAIIAAGLLLPDGRPRQLFGEAGLIRALGEVMVDDGGNLARSPLVQMDFIGQLTDLRACYQARGKTMPDILDKMLQIMVPPLLNLVHSDGSLGSWQGSGATHFSAISALVEASVVRARPLQDARQWGYQRVVAGRSSLIMDAAPPPHPRFARSGCASTLAFEFCAREHRLVVNCGGAALAGGQVPKRTEQGLRTTGAHSTLILDDMNSSAILPNGRIGKGVDEVEVERRVIATRSGKATQIEASHDGYVRRFGLLHRRVLILRDDGCELRGEDILVPTGSKGHRGKIKFAIRFHIGPGIEIGLSDDGKGAGLALPDGSYWQFRFTDPDGDAKLAIDDSLWVDGDGRPRAIEQLVIEGMASRGGGSFSWLFKKMG